MAYNRIMNILGFSLAVGIVFVLVCGSEIYWRQYKTHGELSRKFIHITVGSFIATWPFFLTWGQIQLLSGALILVIALSRYLNFFKAIHSVDRTTWGEFFFAAAVLTTSLITHDKFIFATAILQMSLADGLAAVVGTKYGKKSRYLVAGHAKSLTGTMTFVIVSLLLLAWYGLGADVTLEPVVLLAIAFGAAAIENLGIFGLDNLLVPVLVAMALRAY